ncbi:MAG TPA: MFS transporter [Caulobacteraceae bacterium]|jgi:GPH family glycoside/pentoside/hexuronide:cation symporter
MAPPATGHAARSLKLGLGALGVYGSGALVENVTTAAIGGLLLFYLTVICGLSGSYAGAALGITLVVDSLIDPIVGSISDNSRSRHGRRHPFMVASVIPILVAFGLLFSVPHGLKGLALFGYALATLLSLRVAISFFYVPYMALGAELTDDYTERSHVVSARVLFTVIGGLASAILTWGVFLKGANGRFEAAKYSPLIWTLCIIVAVGALISTFGTLRARNRLHAAPAGGRFSLGQLGTEVLEVLRNRSFISLFMPCLILFTALGVAGTLTLHANTFFWKLTSGQILLLTLVAPIGVFGGIFVTGPLTKLMEKRSTAMLGLLLIGVAQLGPVVLRLTGVISLAEAVPALAVAVVLGGFGGAIATIAFQSMMADATDEHEHLFGARREGLYFAGITLSAKASSGLGAWIGGIALDVIGFPHGIAASPAALASIPPETIRNLGIAYGPGAAVFTAVSVVVLMTYRLTKADHARIQADLQARRAEKAAF